MSDKPREIKVQEVITSQLINREIYPYSTIYTTCMSDTDDNGTLIITFLIPQDLQKVLNILDYYSICDRSGYLVLENTQTLVLTGVAVINAYVKL